MAESSPSTSGTEPETFWPHSAYEKSSSTENRRPSQSAVGSSSSKVKSRVYSYSSSPRRKSRRQKLLNTPPSDLLPSDNLKKHFSFIKPPTPAGIRVEHIKNWTSTQKSSIITPDSALLLSDKLKEQNSRTSPPAPAASKHNAPVDRFSKMQVARMSDASKYHLPGQQSQTLGRHLARRLVEIGVRDVFNVPGDFNLILLDHLLAEPGLNMVGCCNELNAGYAADGYARCKGVGAVVVTFTVGGLSVINAIAGAYSENLPVICIVGGPNSNDYGTDRILHHTIGLPDFSQELRCFEAVTCCQVIVNYLETAYEMVDLAISTCLKESKPVYLSISCNLPGIHHSSFVATPIPFAIAKRMSNPLSLESAVIAAADFLNGSAKPVLVAGPKLRVANAKAALVEFANACGYPVAIMPSAKGQFPENHPKFIGTYWGAVSSPFAVEIVESADAYIFVGPIFNDYSSVGYSLLIKSEKMVNVQPDRVIVCNGLSFGCCLMKDFLPALAKRIKKNECAWENYKRIWVPPGIPDSSRGSEPLKVNQLFLHIQNMLSKDSAVIAETGDSWFNCQKLRLPDGCGYEFQMQYGSIGWAVGATLGYAQATVPQRVIACIGDGSFQVTCQDVSTMIRQELNPVIFLINNGGYTIEVEIHDGPYNVIKNWDYCGLINAIHNGEGRVWTKRTKLKVYKSPERPQQNKIRRWYTSSMKKHIVTFLQSLKKPYKASLILKRPACVTFFGMGCHLSLEVHRGGNSISLDGRPWWDRIASEVHTEAELVSAIKEAMGPHEDSLCFIEVMCHKDDTSRELLEWGSRVSAANGRKPNPQ